MEKRKTVLILTAPYGNGHIQVAEQIRKEFLRQGNYEVLEYDLYSEEFPMTSKWTQKIYLRTYKPGLTQQLYRFAFYGSDKIFNTKIAKPYMKYGLTQLVSKINEVKPDIIINTYPVACAYFLDEKGINLPLYTVITDYYANGNWISDKTRLHFLSSANVSYYLKRRDISEDHYKVTGIPVRNEFYKEIKLAPLYEKYNLDPNKKTLLIVSGAHGVMPKTDKVVKHFIEEDHIQVVVICGKNKKLYKRLMKQCKGYENLHTFGYVNEIHELMRISDLMITKPGGITMTEAANLGVPVVLFMPTYGQELENAIYFSQKHAATIALQEDELVFKVLSILNDESLLEEMKRNIKDIGIKDSTSNIVHHILDDYKVYLNERNEN
ncbi:MGDG synthase family glycosyltransferase [Haloplasma contractile]|uniref:Processive diacylglycerol glucosyltransferase protein n=1 Tax=Haloplasma contractile SSD-17B TaxID=1033810 RepID=U2E898_9MOLU|nr:glycosyltransferase [Haloplasma contractile]ERJ11116.1 Processive diacylglycerol glucosyltransferase protein [Haloplasma contractile SSD-17B]